MTTPIDRQCKGHTMSGQCRKAAIRGGTVCEKHGGGAPHVRNAANNRLLALAEPTLADIQFACQQLRRVMEKDPDNVEKLLAWLKELTKLGKLILDRIGLGAKQTIEVHRTDARELANMSGPEFALNAWRMYQQALALLTAEEQAQVRQELEYIDVEARQLPAPSETPEGSPTTSTAPNKEN